MLESIATNIFSFKCLQTLQKDILQLRNLTEQIFFIKPKSSKKLDFASCDTSRSKFHTNGSVAILINEISALSKVAFKKYFKSRYN